MLLSFAPPPPPLPRANLCCFARKKGRGGAGARACTTAVSSAWSLLGREEEWREPELAQRDMANIKVAVRVRPLSKRESAEGARIIVEVDDKTARIRNQKLDHRLESSWDTRERIFEFGFDYCYWSVDPDDPKHASQEVVYQDLGTSVLSGAIKGYNVCLFAYGQTGSGKTYTMMGTPASVGLTPRICEGLFSRNDDCSGRPASCSVEVSFLEIYNERVRDLLKQSDRKKPYTLRVREHPEKGPYVQGLSRHLVNDYKQVVELLEEGIAKRITAATHVHDASSRSHAIFTIQYTQAILENNLPSEIISKINLVDLAGSERASPSYCKDRLTEGSNINKSLVTLGIVISALAQNSQMFSSCQSINSITSEGDSCSPGSHSAGSIGGSRRQSYIPYRDSVLTWLLKDSLGGNSKTIMIATISPASTSYNETMSALRYASNAKNIINKPRVNEDANVKLIRELREEIDRLKNMLMSFELRNCSPSFSDDRDGNLTELVLQNELKIEQLTKDWTDKWADKKAIMEEYNVDINKRKSSVVIDSSLPHLIAMDDDILSTGVVLYRLREGTTRIGRNDSHQEQDIVLQSQWMEKDHCVIDNKRGIVTLKAVQGAHCSVNGREVTSSCRLSQGAVIVLGKVHKFRFNHPAEAAVLRERRLNSDISFLESSSLEWLDLDGDLTTSTFRDLSPLLPASQDHLEQDGGEQPRDKRNLDAVHEEYRQKLKDLETLYRHQVQQQQLYVEDLKQQILAAQIKAEQELENDQALINQQIKENQQYLIVEEKRLTGFQQQCQDSSAQTEVKSYVEAEVQNTEEIESCPSILVQGRKKLVELELLHRYSLRKAERNIKRKRVKFHLERIVNKQKLLEAKKKLQQLEAICWHNEDRSKQTWAQDPSREVTTCSKLFRRSNSLSSGSLQSWRKDTSELSTSSPTFRCHEVHLPRKSLSVEHLSGNTTDFSRKGNLSLERDNSLTQRQMAKSTKMGTVNNQKRTEKGFNALCPAVKPLMIKRHQKMDKPDIKSAKSGPMNQTTNSSPGQMKNVGPDSICEGTRMAKSKVLTNIAHTGRPLKNSSGKIRSIKDPVYPEKSVKERKELVMPGKPSSRHSGQTMKALKKEPSYCLKSFHRHSEKQDTLTAVSSVEDFKKINVSVPLHQTDKRWYSAEMLSTGISRRATDLLENWQEDDNEFSDTDSLYSLDSLSSAYAKALTEQLKEEESEGHKGIPSQEEFESDDSQMSQDSLVEREIKPKKQSKRFLQKLKPLKQPIKGLTDMSVPPSATSYFLGSGLVGIERSISLDSLADVEAALESDSSDEMPAEVFWKLQSPRSLLSHSEDPSISEVFQKAATELTDLEHSFFLDRKEDSGCTQIHTPLVKEMKACLKENTDFCDLKSRDARETPLIVSNSWSSFDPKRGNSSPQMSATSFPETLEFLEAGLPGRQPECWKVEENLKQSVDKDLLLFTCQELQSTAQSSCTVRNINKMPSKQKSEELSCAVMTQSCNNELGENGISTRNVLLSTCLEEKAFSVHDYSQNTPDTSLLENSVEKIPEGTSDSTLVTRQSNTAKYDLDCGALNSFSVTNIDKIKKENSLCVTPLAVCAHQGVCKNEVHLSSAFSELSKFQSSVQVDNEKCVVKEEKDYVNAGLEDCTGFCRNDEESTTNQHMVLPEHIYEKDSNTKDVFVNTASNALFVGFQPTSKLEPSALLKESYDNHAESVKNVMPACFFDSSFMDSTSDKEIINGNKAEQNNQTVFHLDSNKFTSPLQTSHMKEILLEEHIETQTDTALENLISRSVSNSRHSEEPLCLQNNYDFQKSDMKNVCDILQPYSPENYLDQLVSKDKLSLTKTAESSLDENNIANCGVVILSVGSEELLSKTKNAMIAGFPHATNLNEKNISVARTCKEKCSGLDSNTLSVCESETFDANQMPGQRAMETGEIRESSVENTCHFNTQCSLISTDQKMVTLKNVCVSMEEVVGIQSDHSDTEYGSTAQARKGENEGIVLSLTLNQAASIHPKELLSDGKIDSREYKEAASGASGQERNCSINKAFAKTEIHDPEENMISDHCNKLLYETSHVLDQNNEMLSGSIENLKTDEGKKKKLWEASQIQSQKSANSVFSNIDKCIKTEENNKLLIGVNKQANNLETEYRERKGSHNCSIVANHNANIDLNKGDCEGASPAVRAVDIDKAMDCPDKHHLHEITCVTVPQKENIKTETSTRKSGNSEKAETFDRQITIFIQKQTKNKIKTNACLTEAEIDFGSVADSQQSLDSVEVCGESNQIRGNMESDLLNAEKLTVAIPTKLKQQEQFMTNHDKECTVFPKENDTFILAGDLVLTPEVVSQKNNLDSIVHSEIKNEVDYNTVGKERVVHIGTSSLPANDILLCSKEIRDQMSYYSNTNDKILNQSEIPSTMFAAAGQEKQGVFSANKICLAKDGIDTNLIIRAPKVPGLHIQLSALHKSVNEIRNESFSDNRKGIKQFDDTERSTTIENNKIYSSSKDTKDVPENLEIINRNGTDNRCSLHEHLLVYSIDKDETGMFNMREVDMESNLEVLNKKARTDRSETKNITGNTNSFKLDNSDGKLNEHLPDKYLAPKNFICNSCDSDSEAIASGLQNLPNFESKNCHLASNDLNLSEPYVHHDLYFGISNSAETVQNSPVAVTCVKFSNNAGMRILLPYYETIMANEPCARIPDTVCRGIREKQQADELVVEDQNRSCTEIIHKRSNDEWCSVKKTSETLSSMCFENWHEKSGTSSTLSVVDSSKAALDSSQKFVYPVEKLSSFACRNHQQAKLNREKWWSVAPKMVGLHTTENASAHKGPADHLKSFANGVLVEGVVELPANVSASDLKNTPVSQGLTNEDTEKPIFSHDSFCSISKSKCKNCLHSELLGDSAEKTAMAECIQSDFKECRALTETREIQISKTSLDSCSVASEGKNNLSETSIKSHQNNSCYDKKLLRYAVVNSGISELGDCLLNNTAAFKHTQPWKNSKNYEANSIDSKKYKYFENRSDDTDSQCSAVMYQPDGEGNCYAFTEKGRSDAHEVERKEEIPKSVVATDERKELKCSFDKILDGKESTKSSSSVDCITNTDAKVPEQLSLEMEDFNCDDNSVQERNTSDYIKDISLGLKVTTEFEVKHNADSGHVSLVFLQNTNALNIAPKAMPETGCKEKHLPPPSISENTDITHSVFNKVPSPYRGSESAYTIFSGSTNCINFGASESEEEYVAPKFTQLCHSLQEGISVVDELVAVGAYYHYDQEKEENNCKTKPPGDSVSCSAASINSSPYASVSCHQMSPSVQTQVLFGSNDLQSTLPPSLLHYAIDGKRHNLKFDRTETNKAYKEYYAVDKSLLHQNTFGILNLVEKVDKQQREPSQLSSACLEVPESVQKDDMIILLPVSSLDTDVTVYKRENHTEFTGRNEILLSDLCSVTALNKNQKDLSASKNSDSNELLMQQSSVDRSTAPQCTALQTMDVEDADVETTYKTLLLAGLGDDRQSQYINGMYQSETSFPQNPNTGAEMTSAINNTFSGADSSTNETVSYQRRDSIIQEKVSLTNNSSHLLLENKYVHPPVKYRNKKLLVSAGQANNFYKNEDASCLQSHRLSAPSITVTSKLVNSLADVERTNPVFTSSRSLQHLNMSVEPPSPTEDTNNLYLIESYSELGPNNFADKPSTGIQMKKVHSQRPETTSFQHIFERPEVTQSLESSAAVHAFSLSNVADTSINVGPSSYSSETEPAKYMEGIFGEFKYQSVEGNQCSQDRKDAMHFSSSDINPYVHPWQQDELCRAGWKQCGFGSASDVSCNQLQLSFDNSKVMRCSSVDNGLNAQNSPFHSHLSSYANARVISSTLSSIEDFQALDNMLQDSEPANSPNCGNYYYPVYDESVVTKLEDRDSQFKNTSRQCGSNPIQVDEIVLLYPSESESSSGKTRKITCEQSTQTVTKTRHKRVNKHQRSYTDVNKAKRETGRRQNQRPASWASVHDLSLHLSQLLHDTSELLGNLSQHHIIDIHLNTNSNQSVAAEGVINHTNTSTQTVVDKDIQTESSDVPNSRDWESQHQTNRENVCMNAQEVNVIVKLLGSDTVDVSQESKDVMLILKDSKSTQSKELKMQSMPNISDCDQHKTEQESFVTPLNLVRASTPFLESFQEIPSNAHQTAALFSPRVSPVFPPNSEKIESSCTSCPSTNNFTWTQSEEKKEQSDIIKTDGKLYYKNTLLVNRASSPILTLSASSDSQMTSSKSCSNTESSKEQNSAVKSLRKEISDFCQGFNVHEPNVGSSSETELDTDSNSSCGSDGVFKRARSLPDRKTVKKLLGNSNSKESRLKHRFPDNSSAKVISTSQVLYCRDGNIFNIPTQHSLKDQASNRQEREYLGERGHEFVGLTDGLSVRQQHEKMTHIWQHPSYFMNLSHASSNEELIRGSVINVVERDVVDTSLEYLVANPNCSFPTSEMSEMTIHLPDEDAVSVTASESNTEILLNENPSFVMSQRPRSYSLRDLPLHNKFSNWSGVQCNSQPPNDVTGSFAALYNDAQKKQVKDSAGETKGKMQLSDSKIREIERLQRERAEIMSGVNLDMNQHPLTVELTEAKLNYGIGETDALLKILQDGPGKDGTTLSMKQKLYERHMKVIENLRKEREEKLWCFRRSRSLSPEKHFRLVQSSNPTHRDLDLPSRRREYLQQLRKDVVDSTRVQKPKTRATQHPSEIELLLRDYQKAREEAKTEIARARDKLRERAEQEKKRLQQQMISHLLKEEVKVKNFLSTSTLCTSSSLSLSSSPTSGYNSSNNDSSKQKGQYRNTPGSKEHSRGDTRGRSDVRNSQLYVSEQSLGNSAGGVIATTLSATEASRRIPPMQQFGNSPGSIHRPNHPFGPLKSCPSTTYQDLSNMFWLMLLLK
ncbi:stAR-related lipid transfer protein 9 [Microcaecilia unicolor]|uniref:StAR-related lipid transfer protein 9 n=1 Tax=Microcaecilia unicolor TaxID=1415580 RepID=A0A6P7YYD8_9AMPH|nr:stAR-related lipid transfer protein 9 [Microcaecilia unicolor]